MVGIVARSGLLMAIAGLVAGCDGPPPAVTEARGVVGHAAEVVALAYTPDGRHLASRGADAIKLRDAETLSEEASWPGDRSPFGGLAISPDGRTLAATLAGRGIVTWDLESHREVGAFHEATTSEPAAGGGSMPSGTARGFGTGLAFAPDGSTLAGPGEDRAGASILLWDRARREASGLGPPGSPATHLAFTPDGRTLVSKGMEGKVRVWDVERRAERTAIAASASYLAAISLSPDGRVVATSGADRFLRSWRLDSGAEVGKLKGHLKAILGIAHHPSGRYIASGDSGGVILLWEVATGRVIAQFRGHKGKVWAIAFRPDGRELATAGEDRRIRIWDFARALAAGDR